MLFKNLIIFHRTLFLVLPSLFLTVFPAYSMACESSFNPQTFTITLPCLKNIDSNNLYNVKMEHIGGSDYVITSVDTFELIDVEVLDVETQIIDIPGGDRKGAIINVSGTHICPPSDIYDNINIKVNNTESNLYIGRIDITLKEKNKNGQEFCQRVNSFYEKTILIDQSLLAGRSYLVFVNEVWMEVLTVP